jgi:hypothetical protein
MAATISSDQESDPGRLEIDMTSEPEGSSDEGYQVAKGKKTNARPIAQYNLKIRKISMKTFKTTIKELEQTPQIIQTTWST